MKSMSRVLITIFHFESRQEESISLEPLDRCATRAGLLRFHMTTVIVDHWYQYNSQ